MRHVPYEIAPNGKVPEYHKSLIGHKQFMNGTYSRPLMIKVPNWDSPQMEHPQNATALKWDKC